MGADKGFFTRVNALMGQIASFLREALAAMGTGIRLLACVNQPMPNQIDL